MARNLCLRQIRELKSLRKFSTSVASRKNEEFIIKSPLGEVEVPKMRFLDRVWKYSAGFQDHVAVKCAETKKSYTYRQVRKNMAVFATSLRKKLCLKENDIVSALLPNSPEFPVVAFGTLQAGCIFSPVNPAYKEIEISHQISTTQPKVIITIPESYDNVMKGIKLSKSNAQVIIVDSPNKPVPAGVIRYSDLAESGEADYIFLDTIEKKNDDVALIPFSSGTTGLPKGVEITYKNLLAAAEIMAVKENCFPILTHGDFQDVVPCILPFFHIYGMVVTLLGHFTNGCKLVTLPRFSTSLYFDVLRNQNPSLLYVVPPVVVGIEPTALDSESRVAAHCASRPSIIYGKLEFSQGFGATETTSLATSTFIGTKDVDFSCCGFGLASTEMMFIDPMTVQPVPIGESGELCIRSPTVMKGYYKNDKATKETMTADGFFRTGDLGHYSPNYGVYVTDRIKELIKVKGMQVAPAELESILRSHPAVQDAAVIGVPHEYYGEAPKAFIIKKNGLNASSEEIQDFVANKVASFKKIEEVVFVNDIPKTSSGKILRKELKKMHA
ncbi:jg27584 [Pararge aegeria aegeria]|uniref:Jg27584 protein n=1 Tax=Pararge aegeria aegeria TaxID=348720 RepID=A0A8S4SE13_9NEOP|nr:jg27584 [Pararge aegeria aegeria]CAH2267402.1 jg27584 [Pararge aegeria aegeria]